MRKLIFALSNMGDLYRIRGKGIALFDKCLHRVTLAIILCVAKPVNIFLHLASIQIIEIISGSKKGGKIWRGVKFNQIYG
jgi:hypothetical protein